MQDQLMAEKIAQTVSYYYITLLSFDTVFKTQVIGWLNLYRERGLDFHLIKVYPLRKLISGTNRKQELTEIRRLYNGSLSSATLLPEWFFLGCFINALSIAKFFVTSLISKKKIVVLTRSANLNSLLEIIKTLLSSRMKIIYDSRAAAAEEFCYNNSSVAEKNEKTYEKIKKTENRMIKISAKVFCVSNALIDYHLHSIPGMDKKKFILYPCLADSNLFYFNSNERELLRNNLRISDRLVLVYSGGLSLSWHIPDKIFDFFKRFKEAYDSAYFMLLTTDIQMVDDLRVSYKLSTDDFFAAKIDNCEIRKYLNAADVALLLREDVPMNNVASPTKFAEYLMCGLPVVISPNVGDYSKLVSSRGIGFVYNENHKTSQIKDNLDPVLSGYDIKKRITLSEWGIENFSKQANLCRITDIFTKIFDE